MGVEQIAIELLSRLGLPGLVIWWLVGEVRSLQKKLDREAASRIEDLKSQLESNEEIVTKVHGMVVTLDKWRAGQDAIRTSHQTYGTRIPRSER
jgi:hypothetical protein